MTYDIESFDFEDGDGEAGKCPYCGSSLTYGKCKKNYARSRIYSAPYNIRRKQK